MVTGIREPSWCWKNPNATLKPLRPILKKYGIPDDFKYLAMAESGFENVVSPAKAVGYGSCLKARPKSTDWKWTAILMKGITLKNLPKQPANTCLNPINFMATGPSQLPLQCRAKGLENQITKQKTKTIMTCCWMMKLPGMYQADRP